MQKKTEINGIKKILDSRVFWIIFSLCAALLIWLYYTSNYAVTKTKTFYGVEVAFVGQDAMRDTLSMVVSDQDASTVNVTLRGTRRDIDTISSSDLRAVVNLSNVTKAGYRAMSYTITYPSTVNQSNIQEASRSPSTIGLQISKLSTVSLPVTGVFEGNAAEGYMVDANEMTFDPANVTFTGPEEELEQISKVQVVVGREEVSSAFSSEANYVLADADGNTLEFEDIQADTETVTVTVPVSTIKQVALVANLVEGGGATADDVIVDVEPATITVAGDAATLDGLNSIAVTDIRLADTLSFAATEYDIVLPNGVECVSGDMKATVSLEFTGLKYNTFIVKNLSTTDVPEGYTCEIVEPLKVVTVRAPEEVFDRIKSNNIRIVADISEAPLGRSRVPTTVYVDGFENAGAVGSYPIYVQLEEAQE